jgi:hypothetical protein
MLVAFLAIAVTNSAFRPLRTSALGLLEYLSHSVLAFTVVLGLFFVTAPDLDTPTQASGAAKGAVVHPLFCLLQTLVGAFMVTLNVALVLALLAIGLRVGITPLCRRLRAKRAAGGGGGGVPQPSPLQRLARVCGAC